MIHILGLNHGIFDPEEAQEGICELVWEGLWRDRTSDGPSRQIEAYETVHKQVKCYLAVLNIFFAELDADNRMLRHIEGCIGWNLRNKHPEAKMLYPDDNQIGAMKEKRHGELLTSFTEHIRGLDSRIPY